MGVVATAAGRIWIGDAEGSISRIELTDGVPQVAATIGLPGGGEVRVEIVAGRLLATSKNEIWEVGESNGSLTRFGPGPASLGGRVGAIGADTLGNVWIGSSPPVVMLGGGKDSLTLSSIRAHAVAAIVAEPGGAVLLATEHGLFRHEGSPRGPAAPLPRPAFARITVDGQTVVFGGATTNAPPEAELGYSVRRLRIDVAPLSYRHGIRFATRVEGIDSGWTAPSDDPVIELTQLAPGRYTVHVRTTGPSGA